MISRTGCTGERGYEIFCRAADAPLIWDTILHEGRDLGIVPAAFTTPDLLRVESYLLFYPYDNSEMWPFDTDPAGDTLWELGLDHTGPGSQPGWPDSPRLEALRNAMSGPRRAGTHEDTGMVEPSGIEPLTS